MVTETKIPVQQMFDNLYDVLMRGTGGPRIEWNGVSIEDLEFTEKTQVVQPKKQGVRFNVPLGLYLSSEPTGSSLWKIATLHADFKDSFESAAGTSLNAQVSFHVSRPGYQPSVAEVLTWGPWTTPYLDNRLRSKIRLRSDEFQADIFGVLDVAKRATNARSLDLLEDYVRTQYPITQTR